MSTSSTTPEAGQQPEPTPAPLTPERLAEYAALVQAATEGPWRREDDAPSLTRLVVSDDSTLVVSLGYVGNRTQDDAAFIAAARTAVPELLAEVERLTDRVAHLEAALTATGRSLSSFIFDSDDPGTAALGAQWLYHQALPQADDPFAQPRAFRSSVFSEAARAAEALDAEGPEGLPRVVPQPYLDGYSDGVQAVAERLEKLADEAAKGGDQ